MSFTKGNNITWPSDIRDGVILGERYAISKFADQTWGIIENYFDLLGEKYNVFIELFEKLGGICATDDEERTVTYSLGSLTVIMYFDEYEQPYAYGTFNRMFEEPLEEGEICVMVNAIMSVTFRDSIDAAILKTRMSRTYLRNGEMVNGIQAMANRLHQDNVMLGSAVSGGNIKKIDTKGLM